MGEVWVNLLMVVLLQYFYLAVTNHRRYYPDIGVDFRLDYPHVDFHP
jgi:hypothetical protein